MSDIIKIQVEVVGGGMAAYQPRTMFSVKCTAGEMHHNKNCPMKIKSVADKNEIYYSIVEDESYTAKMYYGGFDSAIKQDEIDQVANSYENICKSCKDYRGR